jgi:signal transduction histidine kinase
MSALRRVGMGRAATAAVAVCVLLPVLMEVFDFDPSVGNRRFHVALETVDAMVLIFLAAVLLGRFRSDGSRRNLLLVGGVVVLAAKNGLFAALAMFEEDPIQGAEPIVWGTALSGVVGAIVLASAAVLADRRIDNSAGRAAGVVVLGCGIVVAMPLLVGAVVGDLPRAFPLLPDEPDDVTELDAFSGHPLKIGIDLVTAVAYAVAATAFLRSAKRSRDDFIGWMGIGCIIASAAFVYYAMIPSRFTELIYGGEILWICAIAAFSWGAVTEIANLEAALVQQAVRAERRRVARDLHDGVVQELAYISTQTDWLAGRAAATPLEPAIARISDAVDRALDESRGAIAALNREVHEPLHLAVGNAARDVADRVGVDLELVLDERAEASGEWRDALIRIAREAVGNAVRHGGATSLRLTLAGQPPILRVEDNGVGFDPGAPRSPHSFGIRSMRERAESLGGTFVISSSPDDGTTVEVVLPGHPAMTPVTPKPGGGIPRARSSSEAEPEQATPHGAGANASTS